MSVRCCHRDGLGAQDYRGEAAPVKWSGVLSLSLLLSFATGEGQAEAGDSSAADAFRPSLSVTPYYQGKADLDGGGSFSAAGAITRFRVTNRLGDKGFWGLTLLTLYSMLCNYGQIHRHRVLLDWKVQGRYPRRGILAGVMRGNN